MSKHHPDYLNLQTCGKFLIVKRSVPFFICKNEQTNTKDEDLRAILLIFLSLGGVLCNLSAHVVHYALRLQYEQPSCLYIWL